mmetsp:Transcript_3419/g.12328  ORF Transcript_3419/g.12328 Transcript_3419/m.12328 type:complete len:94 (-) Transcript_3419:555-836(-)
MAKCILKNENNVDGGFSAKNRFLHSCDIGGHHALQQAPRRPLLKTVVAQEKCPLRDLPPTDAACERSAFEQTSGSPLQSPPPVEGRLGLSPLQ